MPQTILTVLDRAETAAAVLATAALTQRRLAAGPLRVLHIRHDAMEGFMPTEDVMTPHRRQVLTEQAERQSAAIRAEFDRWRAANDSAVWQERIGDTAEVMRAESATADLVVVGRPIAGPARRVLHTLLFEVRALTLIAPSAAPATLGSHAVVAWKDNEPAQAVLKRALPLLTRADKVTLLIGHEGSADLTEEPAWFQQALVAANVPVSVRRFAAAGSIGEALLAEAQAVGGDLLVMGAYSHSRLRELVLGGATRTVLTEAPLPVLLQH